MPKPQALREITQFEYVLASNQDDPPEDQVTFKLCGLNGRERAQVRQLLLQTGDGERVDLSKAFDASETAVALGLKGWSDNFTREDRNGEEQPVKWPGSGRKAVKMLPDEVVQELALEVMKASELAEDERGN